MSGDAVSKANLCGVNDGNLVRAVEGGGKLCDKDGPALGCKSTSISMDETSCSCFLSSVRGTLVNRS